MRFTPAALATAIILGTVSSASIGAPPRVSAISPLSLAMQAQADRLRGEGQLNDAIGYYETALAADPRNVDAYIGLGQIARAQHLPGKAVRLYRTALNLAPNNLAVLADQGEALVERGAVARARQNLARLQILCGQGECPAAARLTQALNGAGERTALRPEEVLPRPVVEADPNIAPEARRPQ
ncbi:MAG: tetratricopeptide repeat protein [Sphingopyxis sp.]